MYVRTYVATAIADALSQPAGGLRPADQDVNAVRVYVITYTGTCVRSHHLATSIGMCTYVRILSSFVMMCEEPRHARDQAPPGRGCVAAGHT